MTKDNDLWMAYASGRLTVSASIQHKPESTELLIKFDGCPTESHGPVTSLIADYLDNNVFDCAVVDFCLVDFFNGSTINDLAVDLLLVVTGYFARSQIRTKVLMSNAAVRDSVQRALSSPRFRTIRFPADGNTAPQWAAI